MASISSDHLGPHLSLSFQEAGGFHLHIRDVSEDDNGTYICQVNTDPPINQVSEAFES